MTDLVEPDRCILVPCPRPMPMPTASPAQRRSRGGDGTPPSTRAAPATTREARVAYPAELADGITEAVGLDGSGRLVDVGCGPGSLTLLLAPHVAEAVGVDADANLLVEGERRARAAGTTNVDWRRLRAEELPAGLAPVRLVTFAQSFHWVDRPLVARIVRGMLEPGGAVVHVHATTHEGCRHRHRHRRRAAAPATAAYGDRR